MSDLETAAQRLRDSVAALPDELRHRWRYEAGDSYVRTDLDDAVVPVVADEEGVLIAITASPPTVTLLADLLAAIDNYANQYDGAVWIERAALVLASAILHTDQHDGEGK